MQRKPIAQLIITMGAATLAWGAAAQTASNSNVLQLPKAVEKAVTTHPEVRALSGFCFFAGRSKHRPWRLASPGDGPGLVAEWRSHMPGQSN
jgi:hypothetical protein